MSEALPDLVVLVRRDGVLMGHVGGKGVGALVPPAGASGERLELIWPESAALSVRQAVRRCIAERKAVETRFESTQVCYELRVFPQGPDRALCVIRVAAPGLPAEESPSGTPGHPPPFDRRGFLSRFNDSLSQAALQEKAVALALVHIDGLSEIARVVDAKISDQVLSAAIVRLPQGARLAQDQGADRNWYLGQMSADLLAIVIESADRDTIEHCTSSVCASLRQPVTIGDASFHLTPYAGVSILGQDGSSPSSLLDKARSAAVEARRANSDRIHFFTDTMKLRSLARLDVTREIREAIASRDIRLRYTARHDLASGRLVAQVGYLRWNHELRGELAPAEFLGMAETTGLATSLSRALLEGLREDYQLLAPQLPPDAHLSFGPLRHHLLQDDFVDDVARVLGEGALPASRLEIRISERTFAAMDLSMYQDLRRLGVQIVIDEMGRGFGSLDRLARAPIWGLQLDRAWVTAIRSDSVALRVCRAGISAARALGVIPIATGVDDLAQRDALLELGCRYGGGDLYSEAGRRFDTLIMRRRSQIAS
ncbi:MAG TPA: GGDEF domain-containing phosphodiesterase [Steroidobacteraceae bacterium]|nr:GGDEF domain-containing phosphodiesterase [Steroidobacteraceae bacterium]